MKLKKLIQKRFRYKHGKLKAPSKKYAVLSASRSNFSKKENDKRTRKLKNELKQEGYHPLNAVGVFKENISSKPTKEKSLLVPDMPLHEAEYHGKEFNQEAILENNLEDFVGKRKEELFEGRTKFGAQAEKQTFKTVVKNGKQKVVYSLQNPIVKIKT